MTDRVFHGIAVGGPLNGRAITHHAPFYWVHEKYPTIELTPSNGRKPVFDSVKVFEYAHNGLGEWNFKNT